MKNMQFMRPSGYIDVHRMSEIGKKRYVKKKEFSLINKVFKLSLSLTIIFCVIGLYIMLTNY